MYLDNFLCSDDVVSLFLKNADDSVGDNIVVHNPLEMWNNERGVWEPYDAEKARVAFQAAIGFDVDVEGYNESEHISRIVFVRSDGYHIANIKFLEVK